MLGFWLAFVVRIKLSVPFDVPENVIHNHKVSGSFHNGSRKCVAYGSPLDGIAIFKVCIFQGFRVSVVDNILDYKVFHFLFGASAFYFRVENYAGFAGYYVHCRTAKPHWQQTVFT